MDSLAGEEYNSSPRHEFVQVTEGVYNPQYGEGDQTTLAD